MYSSLFTAEKRRMRFSVRCSESAAAKFVAGFILCLSSRKSFLFSGLFWQERGLCVKNPSKEHHG